MQDKTMKISFLIVNYKSLKYLEKCIYSIYKNINNLQMEIIVVNNDKKEIDFLKNIKIKKTELKNIYSRDRGDDQVGVVVIEINKNIGFGKANNIGALKAQGEILCIINPDTQIISMDISILLDLLDEDKKIGIVGPKIIEKNGEVQKWSAGVDLTIFEIILGKLGFSRSKKIYQSKKIKKADWVTGACLFIKKDLFLKVGGFDENFFLYYEDLDLCKRVLRNKKKIIYFPNFTVRHLGGKSSDNINKQKKEYFKSQDYYYKKWFNPVSYLILKLFRFFYKKRYKI